MFGQLLQQSPALHWCVCEVGAALRNSSICALSKSLVCVKNRIQTNCCVFSCMRGTFAQHIGADLERGKH